MTKKQLIREASLDHLTNRDFKIVYQPKTPNSLGAIVKRRRFGVGLQSLCNYIGEQNAITSLKRAVIDTADDPKGRARIMLRKYGIVDFYLQ